MTVSELKDYYLLEDTIQNYRERIAKIEAKLCASPAFDTSGVPKNPTPHNRIEETYIQLAQLKTELAEKLSNYEVKKIRIERYIASIPDLLIRRITEKRVLEHKAWGIIASELGGGNTRDSVKKMFYRYTK